MRAAGATSPSSLTPDYKIWQVIAASAVGTMIEWYDFYIFGSLAAVIAPLFYPQGNETLALIAYLSTFAVGFVVRPFGALFFGRIGDLVGRKYAFLVTLVIMGGATALIGLLPTYATIGLVGADRAPADSCAAGTRARRRVWRRRGLRRRARARRPARLLHQLHPDHRDARAVSLARRDSDRPEHDERADVPRLGLAPAVSALDLPGRDLALHPAPDEGITDLPAHQEHGHDLGAAAQRGLRAVAQPQERPDFAVRRDRRTGRRLVHRTVLCVVLSPDDSQGECHVSERTSWPPP